MTSNRPGAKVYIGEYVDDSGDTVTAVIKIGMTTLDPMKRLTDYAKKHGYTFDRENAKVAVFRVPMTFRRGLEAALHNMFNNERIGNLEIFRIPFDTAVKAASTLTNRDPD